MSSVQDTQLIQDIIKYENDTEIINVCNNYIEHKIKCHKNSNEIRNKISSKKIKNNDYAIGYSCAICINSFKQGEFKKTLGCNHTFHKKCIDIWFCCHNTCPICRFKIE